VSPRVALLTREPYGYAANNPLNKSDPSGQSSSGLDVNDPNYCFDLLKMNRNQNNEVGRRWRMQRDSLSQAFSDTTPLGFFNEVRSFGHMNQFDDQQAKPRSLIDEWNNSPCGGTPLTAGASDWANRDDPYLEESCPLQPKQVRALGLNAASSRLISPSTTAPSAPPGLRD
jgi:hypothetical protein